jgi:hypothetical protein
VINRDIKISIFVLLFDILAFIFFFNVIYFVDLSDEYLIADIILGCIVAVSLFFNTIILIIIKRKINIIFCIDLFLLHVIIIWITLIIFNFRYKIYGFRLFIIPIIILIIYLVFSVILKKKRKV